MKGSENQRERIDDYIETSLDVSIGRVQGFIRQCSVSAEKVSVSKCAQMLRDLLVEAGCKDVKFIETDGNPILLGEYPADSPFTLLTYGMYDTQPFDRKKWTHDPLGGQIVTKESGEKVIYGRGAINSKGPLIAFINSVEAILKTAKKLPVNLKIVADGEEEIGSPSFHRFLRENADQLGADACLAITPTGGNAICLGYKGALALELECNAKKWGKGPAVGKVHSKFKPLLDSPVWHLVKALATLVGDDEDNILVEGFYDEVSGPTLVEKELIDRLSNTVSMQFLSRFGPLPDRLKGFSVENVIEDLLFRPSINISGMGSGHMGTQVATIIPDVAKCRMDIRFVPHQHGGLLVQRLKNHFETSGYGDIVIEVIAHLPWYRVDIDEAIVQAVLKSYNELGFYPQIWPNSGGGCAASVIGRSLNLPVCEGGLVGGGGSHGADEFMVLRTESTKSAGLIECERSYVSILYNFSMLASQE